MDNDSSNNESGDGGSHRWFAGRHPAGTEHPVTLTKNGVRHTQRMPDGRSREILAVGLACSECFSGQNLYKILAPGYEFEGQAMKALAEGQPAAPLSIHTSSGVPEALAGFLKALEVHLPWKNKKELDWCASLQLEGASAVWAAIDMVLQVSMFEGSDKDRTKVAVGATSYHGPPSTCFGAKSPLWYKHHQVIYPVPTAYGSYDEEELLKKYGTFLDLHAKEVGVILFEPQWGSSQAALPWPEHLLKKYVSMARERGIKIICDEIMCGLGRHGKGTLFISEAWDLDPDCVTVSLDDDENEIFFRDCPFTSWSTLLTSCFLLSTNSLENLSLRVSFPCRAPFSSAVENSCTPKSAPSSSRTPTLDRRLGLSWRPRPFSRSL